MSEMQITKDIRELKTQARILALCIALTDAILILLLGHIEGWW